MAVRGLHWYLYTPEKLRVIGILELYTHLKILKHRLGNRVVLELGNGVVFYLKTCNNVLILMSEIAFKISPACNMNSFPLVELQKILPCLRRWKLFLQFTGSSYFSRTLLQFLALRGVLIFSILEWMSDAYGAYPR